MRLLVPLLVGCLIVMSVVARADEKPATTRSSSAKVKIVLVGDSTVTDKSGWGVGFAALLDDGVKCVNLSQGGRSSKSYRSEGWWDKAMADKGDQGAVHIASLKRQRRLAGVAREIARNPRREAIRGVDE